MMVMTDDQVRAHVEMHERVLGQVRALLARQLRLSAQPEEIDPDVPLFSAGLGLDSIDAVELVVALQREFGLRLPEGDSTIASLRTVNTLVARVVEHQGGPSVAR
jgi:acyl carrier protein